jgi:hypothetical protein
MRRLSFALLLLAPLVIAPGCAAPWDEPTTHVATAEDDVVERIDAALERLNAASAKMRGGGDEIGAEGLLYRELLQIGPALTTEQKAAFAKAFWEQPDHQQVMTDYFAAAKGLEAELASLLETKQASVIDNLLGASMKQQAGIENKAFVHRRDVVFDAAVALAATPTPYVALRIGGLILASDHFEETDPFRKFVALRRNEVDDFDKKVREKLVVTPLLPAAVQLAVEKGTSEGVMTGLRDAVENIRRGYASFQGAYGMVKGGALTPLLDALDAVIRDQTGGALAGVSPKAMISGTKVENLDKVANGVATFLAVWDTGSAAADGDLKKFVTSAPAAISGVAQLTITIRRITLGAARAETPFLKAASTYAGKFAAGVGVITSAIALADSLDDNDGTLADKLDILGDAASLGAAIAALAGASVAAPVLAAVALGAHYIAGILAAHALEKEMQADIKDALGKVSFPLSNSSTDIRSILLVADPQRLAELSGEVKLDPTQIQKLILLCPPLVSSVLAPRQLGFVGMGRFREEFGMNGAQMFSLFEAVRATGGKPGSSALRVFQLALSFDNALLGGGLDPGGKRCDRWRAFLKNERERDDTYFQDSGDRKAWQSGIDAVIAKLPAKCTPEPED